MAVASGIKYLLLALTVLGIISFFFYYFRILAPRRGTTEWIKRAVNPARFKYRFRLYGMEKRDVIPLAIILVVFLFVDFWNLGDTKAPVTFEKFTDKNQSALIELPAAVHISKVMYYSGLYTGYYSLEYSLDNITWTEIPSSEPDKRETAMEQSHAHLFKWRYTDYAGFMAAYLRITPKNVPLELGEVALLDESGNLIAAAGPEALFDEQHLVPEEPTYMNSMYFDEIYHGRTAFETLRNLKPYETVHPPLGKTLISAGVALFGMTPFGWRCAGTLFGVGMLAALYVLLKNMFGKTAVAICGTLLFAFDFMHYTQTRIATIDTYGVFFIILAFLFMYRFIAQKPEQSIRGLIRPLALSGLFFGLGAASKWIVIYAGFGLLVLYILKLITDYTQYYVDEGTPGEYLVRSLKIIALTAVFFIVIPVIIYILAYIPLGLAHGMKIGEGMLWDIKYYHTVWTANVNMFKYHADLEATHPYQSSWYQWILNIRPILYYYRASADGLSKSSFAAFNNPIISWAGLAAVGTMVYRFVKHRDARAFVIALNYFAQLVPWMLISRCVFAYHYFPSAVFLVIAVTHMFNTIFERGDKNAKFWVYGFTAAAGVLFVLFYPVLSGMEAPISYTKNVLQWFGTWTL